MTRIWRSAVVTVQVGFGIHCFREYVAEIHACQGPSMLPTLNVYGDLLLVSKLHRYGRFCQVGDVVMTVHPLDAQERISKRILGFPGDLVCIEPRAAAQEFIKVPEGSAWLCGDNLEHSRDSRTWGPIPLALIRGKVMARVYPDPKWI
jgi:inner membrane protease subunit 1